MHSFRRWPTSVASFAKHMYRCNWDGKDFKIVLVSSRTISSSRLFPTSPLICSSCLLRLIGNRPLMSSNLLQASTTGLVHQSRLQSTDPGRSADSSADNSREAGIESNEKTLSLYQRFKNAYKQYGKVLIGVHLVTSAAWFSSFVYLASQGVDIVPLLEKMGFSETMTKPFHQSGLGHFAVAYLFYKVATPVRYTVTLGGTQVVVRYMQRKGFMAPVSEADKLRNLMKEGSEKVKDKAGEMRGEMKIKYKDWTSKYVPKDSRNQK